MVGKKGSALHVLKTHEYDTAAVLDTADVGCVFAELFKMIAHQKQDVPEAMMVWRRRSSSTCRQKPMSACIR